MKVFQSVDERAPVVVEFAVRIPNTPVRLLYVRGHTAERAVSPILVATVDERVERVPDNVDTVVVRFERFEFVVSREPERVFTRPERVDTLEFVVARLVVRVARLPVAVARLVLVVARLLFVVAILPVIAAIVPESAFCARVFVK